MDIHVCSSIIGLQYVVLMVLLYDDRLLGDHIQTIGFHFRDIVNVALVKQYNWKVDWKGEKHDK